MKKNNLAVSLIALGSWLYFAFCLLTFVASFYWITSLLAKFPTTNMSRQQVVSHFATFIEDKQNNTITPTILNSTYSAAKASQKKKKYSALNSTDTKNQSPLDSRSILYIEQEENQKSSEDVRHCLSGETDPSLIAILVSYKKMSLEPNEETNIANELLTRMKSKHESYRKKIILGLKSSSEIYNCGAENHFLMEISRDLFGIHTPPEKE